MQQADISQSGIDDQSPWGTYRPSPLIKFLIVLARNTPLGRGKGRHLIREALLALVPHPIDHDLYGSRVRCYLRGNLCEWKAFLGPRRYDPFERDLIAKILDRDKAVFLDIGANIGMYALAAVSSARKDARVICFEPHPITFRRLQYNVAQNTHGGISIVQAALGASDGQVTLSSSDLSFSSVVGGNVGETVPMRRLLTGLADLSIDHIDVMKIDVEGYEDQVLGDFTAKAPDALIPELVIIEHLGAQIWKQDCIEMLQKRGLVVAAKVNNNTLLVRPGSRAAALLPSTY